MIEKIKSFILKLIPKNIAGILGIVQLVIPALREVIMAGLRLAAIIMPVKVTEASIVKVKEIADKIEVGFDTVKRVLLGLEIQ